MPHAPARWTRPLLALALALALTGDAPACPSCKEALANQTGGAARVQEGYTYSILFMIAMPFALFGSGAFLVYRAARSGRLPEM